MANREKNVTNWNVNIYYKTNLTGSREFLFRNTEMDKGEAKDQKKSKLIEGDIVIYEKTDDSLNVRLEEPLNGLKFMVVGLVLPKSKLEIWRELQKQNRLGMGGNLNYPVREALYNIRLS